MQKEKTENFIYGFHPVEQILIHKPYLILKIIAKKDLIEKRKGFDKKIKANNIRVEFRDNDFFKRKYYDLNHQGIIAEIKPYEYLSMEELEKKSKSKNGFSTVILLDCLKDPHNFGAIIRSGVISGFHNFIIPKDRNVEVTPTVIKSSSGFIWSANIARVVNLQRSIKSFKEKGFWVVGTDIGGQSFCYDYDFKRDVVLVFGEEGKGMRKLIAESCDDIVKIPMNVIGSFNVSVSCGIVCYEVNRQRIK